MKPERFILLFIVLQVTGAHPSRLLFFYFALRAPAGYKHGEEYEHWLDIVK